MAQAARGADLYDTIMQFPQQFDTLIGEKGDGAAMGMLAVGRLSFGNEGQVLAVTPDPAIFVAALVLAR